MRNSDSPFSRNSNRGQTFFLPSTDTSSRDESPFSTDKIETLLLLKPNNKEWLQSAMRKIICEKKFRNLLDFICKLKTDPQQHADYQKLDTLLNSPHLRKIWDSIYKKERDPFSKSMHLAKHELNTTEKLMGSSKLKHLTDFETFAAIELSDRAFDYFWFYRHGIDAYKSVCVSDFTGFYERIDNMLLRLQYIPNETDEKLLLQWKVSLPSQDEAIKLLHKYYQLAIDENEKAALYHGFTGLWVKAIMKIDSINENQQYGNFNIPQITRLIEELEPIGDEMVEYYAGVGYAAKALFCLASAKHYQNFVNHLKNQKGLFAISDFENEAMKHTLNSLTYAMAALLLEEHSRNLSVLSYPKTPSGRHFYALIYELFTNQLQWSVKYDDMSITFLYQHCLCSTNNHPDIKKSLQAGAGLAGEFLVGNARHYDEALKEKLKELELAALQNSTMFQK